MWNLRQIVNDQANQFRLYNIGTGVEYIFGLDVILFHPFRNHGMWQLAPDFRQDFKCIETFARKSKIQVSIIEIIA